MNVVGHEAVSIDRDVVLLTISSETFQIDLVIAATEEGLLSLVAANDNVVEKAGSKDPWASSHERRLPQSEEHCQDINA